MSTNKTNKRKHITIDTKAAIINAVDEQEKSNAQTCREFEIVSSTLYTILKDNDKILNIHASGDFTGERKKTRQPDFYQIAYMKCSFCSSNKRTHKIFPLLVPNCWKKETNVTFLLPTHHILPFSLLWE